MENSKKAAKKSVKKAAKKAVKKAAKKSVKSKEPIDVFSEAFIATIHGPASLRRTVFWVECNMGERMGPFDNLQSANNAASEHFRATGHLVRVVAH